MVITLRSLSLTLNEGGTDLKPDIVSAMVFLHGSWDLVKKYWVKEDKEERDTKCQKNLVVLDE